MSEPVMNRTGGEMSGEQTWRWDKLVQKDVGTAKFKWWWWETWWRKTMWKDDGMDEPMTLFLCWAMATIAVGVIVQLRSSQVEVLHSSFSILMDNSCSCCSLNLVMSSFLRLLFSARFLLQTSHHCLIKEVKETPLLCHLSAAEFKSNILTQMTLQCYFEEYLMAMFVRKNNKTGRINLKPQEHVLNILFISLHL